MPLCNPVVSDKQATACLSACILAYAVKTAEHKRHRKEKQHVQHTGGQEGQGRGSESTAEFT